VVIVGIDLRLLRLAFTTNGVKRILNTLSVTMGVQRLFSMGRKSGEISFYPRETKKTTIFC